jgi:hypothetical protein
MDSVLRYNEAPRMLVDPEDFRPARPAPVEDAAVARPEPLPGDQVPGQTTIDDQIALAGADRLARVQAIDASLTADHTSAEQVIADAPKTTEAEKPGYKPRSRARKRT